MKTVASILIEHFKHWGVTHVFGVPGKAVVPFVIELGDQGVHFVLCRHEAGAGYAAAGYALKKKTLGVALGTSGPGGTNMLTAAGQAKADHAPVLFITGHPSMKDTGKAFIQDSTFFGTDLVHMFEPVTLFSARLERGDLLQSYLAHAVEKAFTGRKGPVHLSIPSDVLTEKIPSFSIPLPSGAPNVFSADLERIIPPLYEAKRPVLFVGKGVHLAEAYEEVRILAEYFQIPVITSPGGKGSFPTYHPLSLGAFGIGGTPQASEYLKSGVDLMIVIGSKLSDVSLAGFTEDMYPQKIIQFDVDPTFAGKSLPVPTLVVLGDAKYNLRKLLEKLHRDLRGNLQTAPALEVAAGQEEPVATLEDPEASVEECRNSVTPGYITAAETMKVLRKCLPEDAIVFADDGSHGFYAVRYYDIYQVGTFHFDSFFATMGHAIGYAIGAKLADPDRTVVCLTGDGCLFMNGSEISTAVNEQAAVLFVVLNNGRLDMVYKGMSHHLGRTDGTVYQTPLNVKQYAESMGATAFCCRTAEEIENAIACALANPFPTVIEIITDPDEIPPTLARG